MTKRVSYEIREVDRHGDVLETVLFEHGRGARGRCRKHLNLRYVRKWNPWHAGAVAAVLERVTRWVSDEIGVEDVECVTLACAGDKPALVEAGYPFAY